jgi:hypothetical protein
MAIVILQNRIAIGDFKKTITIIFSISIIYFAIITFIRLDGAESVDFYSYLSAEVFQRFDGLELISLLMDRYNYSILSIEFDSLINPLAASIPIFEISNSLKASGMTTIKSIILIDVLNYPFPDANSFAILDAYYWGGLLSIVLTSLLFGYLAKIVDIDIGKTKNIYYQLFLISIASTLILMERETIGILLGIFINWMILIIIYHLTLGSYKVNT